MMALVLIGEESTPVPAILQEGRYWLDDNRDVDKDDAVVVLTPKQVAARLHATLPQVYRWLRSEKLRGVRVARYFWYVYASALIGFVPPKRGRPKTTERKE